ncbi:MAG: hypothetical protein WCP92_07680 [bacterium]
MNEQKELEEYLKDKDAVSLEDVVKKIRIHKDNLYSSLYERE